MKRAGAGRAAACDDEASAAVVDDAGRPALDGDGERLLAPVPA